LPALPYPRCVLWLIDVEPDARKPVCGVRGGWEGTREALPLIEAARRELEKRTATPVVINWFFRFDPQIEQTWGRADHALAVAPDLLGTIASHGDYAGIHPHLWRWHPHARDWFNDFSDAWMEHCLDTAVATFASVFDRRPEASRFGDRWLNDTAMRALAARGIRYDLSLEPGRPAEPPLRDRLASGMLPDTRNAPRVPFQRDGAAGPWIVPLTTSAPRWQPVWYRPLIARASVNPNLGSWPALVAPHLEHELARRSEEPLVIVLRTGDFCSRRRQAWFRRNLARMLAHPGLDRCVFTTPPVAIRRWIELRDAASRRCAP